MTNQGFSKYTYHLLDRVTDVIPSFGTKVFQKIFQFIFGSQLFYSYCLNKFRRQLLRTKNFDKILIVVDINIGDAVILQNGIEAARYNFPDARIDYMCSQKGGDLINSLPMVDNIYNIFTAGGVPSAKDQNSIKEIITTNNYSLILNLSPFVTEEMLSFGGNVIHLYVLFSAYIIHLWNRNEERLNISNIIYVFINEYLKPLRAEIKSDKLEIVKKPSHPWYKGNIVYLSHEAIVKANEFLFSHKIFSMDRLLLFNPDVTIKYSMIPFDTQIQVLKNILLSGETDYILITAAYVNKGIEEKIIRALPKEFHSKIFIVPYMELDTYTALIDLCDVFLTGDTGTLHIAASWKEPLDGISALRNRTAVISVIGATDSRMFCYDSEKPGHMAAYQDAPSKVFVANSPCRNITCLNKTVKTCKEIRCFAHIDPDEISTYIVSYFKYLKISLRKIG